MAELDLSTIAATSIATPDVGVVSIYADSSDSKRIKARDENTFTYNLNNLGMQGLNILTNGGFSIQQRVTTAINPIPGVSTTTRAGKVADRWAVTTGNATATAWTQVNTGLFGETNLLSRHYGIITQSTNAAKWILSQFLSSEDISHIRGQQIRLSVKVRQTNGAAANFRLGLLQFTGSVDVDPTFISAIGADTVDPSWGTNLTLIVPDSAGIENGTLSGNAITIAGTSNWVRSSATFIVPSALNNLVPVLYRDTAGGANDATAVAEFQMTQNVDLVDWVTLPREMELQRCLRYFSKSFPLTVVPAASLSEATAGSGVTGILGKAGSGTVLGSQITIQFPVPMFKTPTVTLFTPTASGAVVFRLSGTSPLSQGTTAQRTNSLTNRGVVITATNEATTNGAVGDLVGIHYTADAEFAN